MVEYKIHFRSDIGDMATAESVFTCRSETFPSPDGVKQMIKNLNSKVSQKFTGQTGIFVSPESVKTYLKGIYFQQDRLS